jgi:integrase/recombinase XerD
MSLAPQLDRYLSVRRSLGYDLATSERILRRFTRFADQEGAAHVDTALFLRWDASLPEVSGGTRAARLGSVRLFAGWLTGIDPVHEVPPRGLLPGRLIRARPHIYTDAEIASIIAAAAALPSIYGLRGLTYGTLFALLAVTGLRINEALALDRGDLDVDDGVIRVRRGKLGKERLLPLDPGAMPRSRCSSATRARDCPIAAPATTSRGSVSRSGCGPISPIASMAGVRASTTCATPSRLRR